MMSTEEIESYFEFEKDIEDIELDGIKKQLEEI